MARPSTRNRSSRPAANLTSPRAKIPELEEALAGPFGAHHAILCRQIIDHIDFLDRSIATLNERITERLLPFAAAVAIVTSVPGISKTTAEVVVAETGADMSRFPSPGQLCAWAGVAPAQYARIARHRGPNKSPVAVANSMLFTIRHLLASGALCDDPGADYFECRHDPAREAKRLARRIEALGLDVSLSEKAA